MYRELSPDSHSQTIDSILDTLGDIRKAESSNRHARKYCKQALSMYDQAKPASPLRITAIQDKLEALKTHKTRRCTILSDQSLFMDIINTIQFCKDLTYLHYFYGQFIPVELDTS